ncbi:MAG: aminodeoxychorismate/anthranilate synthase component II [Desulfohalobiaceae bacterium]
MFLLIDNYDSFTYNLVQLLLQEGIEPLVLRNDQDRLLQLADEPELQAVLISPGPGAPENSGLCLPFLQLLPSRVPVLGVCLGHQILAHHAGWPVLRASRIMHGKTSSIEHTGSGIFQDLPLPFIATRYHSLLMDPEYAGPGLSLLQITAWSETGEPMGLGYSDKNWFGIQFHPESILTTYGSLLVRNFLCLAQETQGA